MIDLFPKTFVNGEYKQHRENILFEREKCLLPGTQAEIERDIQVEKVLAEMSEHLKEKKKIEDEYYSKKYTKTQNQYGRYVYQVVPDTPELVAMREELVRLRQLLYPLRVRLRDIRRGGNAEAGSSDEARRTFVRPCPADDCRGFLSTQWKCGMCEARVCKDCLEIKGTGAEESCHEHQCDPQNVESAKLMNKDTKPCPSCGTRIFKISGCSQIWCTHCHVAFNWNTLRIETGVIHNPHYYEYQRQMNGGVAPRNPGDIPGGCCGIPYITECMMLWTEVLGGEEEDRQTLDRLSSFHRVCTHIEMVILPYMPGNANHDMGNTNIDVRKMYLRKRITEDRFKWFLQKREKNRNKNRELRQVIEMMLACGRDVLRKSLVEGEGYLERIRQCDNEIKALVEYYNNTLKGIQKVFGCRAPLIEVEEDYYHIY